MGHRPAGERARRLALVLVSATPTIESSSNRDGEGHQICTSGHGVSTRGLSLLEPRERERERVTLTRAARSEGKKDGIAERSEGGNGEGEREEAGDANERAEIKQ